MHELVLAAGVDAEKVFIGFRSGSTSSAFRSSTTVGGSGRARRSAIPQSAFVVGSFLKDGVGLGDGYEPKLVKGPDTLVAVLDAVARRRSRSSSSSLSGPARGYVRRELESRGIPHRHVLLGSRAELGRAYHALDVYARDLAAGGRAQGGARVAGGRRPARHDRVGQAPELVSRRRERPARRRRRRRGDWLPRSSRIHDDPALARAPATCGKADGGGERRRAAGRPLGRSARRVRRGKARLVRLTVRASGRYARAARRWARLLAPRRAPRRHPGLLRARRRAGGRGARRRRDGQVSAARTPLPQPPRRLQPALSRLDVAAPRSRSAAAARPAAWPQGRREPGRRRVSRLGGRGDRSS